MKKNIKVIKRNNKKVEFDAVKIKTAILECMKAVNKINNEKADCLVSNICKKIEDVDLISVEEIQDLIECCLMDVKEFDLAKAYVLYRENRRKERSKGNDKKRYLSEEFLSKYKHVEPKMTDFGRFVYLRTYSRYLESEGRREKWWETVRRAVEYNCSIENVKGTVSVEEAEKLFDNIFNLRQFLSGRTFWTGNTAASKLYPMSNFNCAFIKLDNFNAFEDIFYASMVGAGIGFRILPEDVEQLPNVRTDIEVVSKAYMPIPKNYRKDKTCIDFNDDKCTVYVGDSKEGWVDALAMFLKIFYSPRYRDVKSILINYDNVRPYGEKLKTFGGTASGHESMMHMITKISKVLLKNDCKVARKKLKTIEVMDIANIIAENVVSGGVRRSAQICLFDVNDKAVLEAKKDLYIKDEDGNWVLNNEISHRRMSNNSVVYKDDPTKEQIDWQLNQMRYNGEPGFINYKSMKLRNPDAEGVNPCGEILLNSKNMCNLTTVNLMAFVGDDGILDVDGILEAQKLSARAGYRMANIELELNEWDAQLRKNRLVGCSITGLQDMLNATNMSEEEEIELYKKMRNAVHSAVKEYARELGEVEPVCMTTVKPEGTLSSIPSCSSGLHYAESEYYVRRVRISAADPLCKLVEDLGYPIYPEVGSEEGKVNTKVVEFPCKAPMGSERKLSKHNVTAIQQLENYKRIMREYCDHNASITVSVRESEWSDVSNWLMKNWDEVVGISFLPLDDAVYPLMPYEAIKKEEYEERLELCKKIDPMLLKKYENEYKEDELIEDSECSTGSCPVR